MPLMVRKPAKGRRKTPDAGCLEPRGDRWPQTRRRPRLCPWSETLRSWFETLRSWFETLRSSP